MQKFSIKVTIVCLILIQFSVLLYKSHYQILTDFTAFYEAVVQPLPLPLSAKKSVSMPTKSTWKLYSEQFYQLYDFSKYRVTPNKVYPRRFNQQYSNNLNSPVLNLFMWPLGFLNYSQALLIFSMLSIIAFCLGLFLLKRQEDELFPGLSKLQKIWLFVAYYPCYINLAMGQWGCFMFLFSVLIYSAWKKQQLRWFGVWVGCACVFRPFMGLFLLLALRQRVFSSLFMTGLIFLAAFLLSSMLLGIHVWQTFYLELHQIDWYLASWNSSLLGLLIHALPNSVRHSSSIILPLPLISIFLGSGLVITFFSLYPALTQNPQKSPADLQCMGIICACLLCSPLGWQYYFVMLLLVFHIFLKYIQHQEIDRCTFILGISAFVFSNIPLELDAKVHPFSWNDFFAILVSLGLLLLWIAFIRLQRRLTSDSPTSKAPSLNQQQVANAIWSGSLYLSTLAILVIPWHMLYLGTCAK